MARLAGRRSRPALTMVCLFMVCWGSVHSVEGDETFRQDMHDAAQGFQPSSQERARALQESGIESRAQQEAKAKLLMEDSEDDQEEVQEEAEQYRHNLSHKHKSPQVGEDALVEAQDGSHTLSPEGARIRRAMEEFDAGGGDDLGEGAAVGVQAANRLTVRAQSQAQAKAAEAAKWQAAQNAKQIAEKVKQLVAQQRQFEDEAGQSHTGMVERQEAVAATRKVTEAAQTSMHDSLVAQRMEAKAAQRTFQHLMEREREEQHHALEAERKRSTAILAAVQKTLADKERQFESKMTKAEHAVEAKLEKTLANAQVSKAIEAAVRAKLSKRVEELTSAGQQVVGGVTDTVASLKRRVQRLRQSQDRMRNEQSSVEQTLATEKAAGHRYLGESSQTQHLEQELAALRLQLTAQPQVMSARQEPSMELENALLKEKLKNSEMRNKLMEKTMVPSYSGTRKYSRLPSDKSDQNARDKARMAAKIQQEEQTLRAMKANFAQMAESDEPLRIPSNSPRPHFKSQIQADIFLQESEHSSELPPYHTLKAKADAVSEQLKSLAEENSTLQLTKGD